MIKNYLLTILRQTKKNSLFSFVNVLGLAMGIAACLIIAQYVFFHVGFDKDWNNTADIYRIQTATTKNGTLLGPSGRCTPMMGYSLAEASPEVTRMARLYNIDYQNNTFEYKGGDRIFSFQESDIYGADKSLFEIFNFTFVAGGYDRFSEPNAIILTEATAIKYDENPENLIGKKLTIGGNIGETEFEIVGVIENLPEKTHLKFSTLISFQSLKDDYGVSIESWTNANFYTYLQVKRNADLSKINETIAALYDENAKEPLNQYGFVMDHELMALSDLHLYSKAAVDFKPSIDYRLIWALAGIALIILVIAWINYLNLSLVKVLERLKEVGIRKVMGSKTRQITLLFMMEAVILNVFSFLLALTFTQLTSPLTENLTGVKFTILGNLQVTLILFSIVVVGSVLIGLYPAIMLRAFNTSNILTGNKRKQKVGGLGLRSALVSFQFIITFLLIGVTLTVHKQIGYMKASDLGINIDNIMVIKSPPGDVSQSNRPDVKKFNSFKTSLLGRSEIEKVTNAGEIPGVFISWGGNIRLSTEPEESSIPSNFFSMGLDFIDFFEIDIIAGRKLESSDSPWGNGAVIINEKMAEMLGFENPEDALEAKLLGFYSPNPIVVKGVAENHHQTSLHNDFLPIVYILSSWTEFYFVKMNLDVPGGPAGKTSRLKETVALIESEWDNSFTDTPIDYYFLDQSFNKQYAADEQFGKIFGTFSALAILIASLGLYGLTAFTLRQRTKEIGIRKVLGAGASNLTILLSKNYFALIGIAYLLATPIAWFSMSQWLENYHFRIELGGWLLAIPLLFVCAIALFTIASRVLRSVKTNPVDSLKYE